MKDLNKKKYAVQICFIVLFVFFGLLLGKGVNAITAQDDFEKYNNWQLITATTTWVKFSGGGNTYARDYLGYYNTKGAFITASSTNQYQTIYINDTNTATGSACFFVKADKGTRISFKTKNNPTSLFAFNAGFVVDNYGLAELNYYNGRTLVYTGNYYNTELNWLNMCFEWNCLTDKYNIKFHNTIYHDINTYDNCGTIGRFEYEAWTFTTANPTSNLYFDNLTRNTFASSSQEATTTIHILPDFTGSYSVGSESDISPKMVTDCLINSACILDFDYGYATIGKKVYLTPDIDGQRSIDYAIFAPRTLTSATYLKEYFLLNTSAVEKQEKFCLYLDNENDTADLYCNIIVNWVSEIRGVCFDVASSTGFFDDFRYGIECGFRKLTFWAFTPTPYAINYFEEVTEKFKNTFPFNTFFDLTENVENAISTTTLSLDNTLGIPFILKTATGSEFYILPVFSSSTIAETIGNDNSALFRTTIGYLFYIITAGVIFIIVF